MNNEAVNENKYLDIINKKTQSHEDEGLRMKFDLTTMNIFCSYVLSDNNFIHRNGLVNLRLLLSQINPQIALDNSQSLIDRYNLCMDVLKSRLDKNLSKKELIIADIQGIMKNKYQNIQLDSFDEVSLTDVQWLESSVIPSYLNAALINNSIYELSELCLKYRGSDSEHFEERINDIYDKIEEIHTRKRKNEIDADNEDTLFKMSEYEDTVTHIWNNQKAGGYKLTTGVTCLNKMLNGGFEGSRVYCFFGPSGGGKSLTIANLLYQIKKYNHNVQCKDPTLKPCIVLLTMENMISEVVQTLYNIVVADEDISCRALDDVLYDIKHSDMFSHDSESDNPIEIFIKFKPINSITTDYLYKLTEELRDDGYEVICMLQDYIMRIKSAERNSSLVDDRIRYGNIINEFKNYAMYYNIPVITASQLNRDASRTIDTYKADGRFDDMMDHIGRANIAESSQIDFNLDAIIFIVPCWEGDVKWEAFKLIKHRYKADLLPSDYVFFHPFVQGMPARIVEDVGRAEPLSKHNLIYNKESSVTAQAFSNASNSLDNTTRFSKNKSLKEDKTVIMKDKTAGFMSLTMEDVTDTKVDYDDGKEKVHFCCKIEEENMDEEIFYSLVDRILKHYKVPQLRSKIKYYEEVPDM